MEAGEVAVMVEQSSQTRSLADLEDYWVRWHWVLELLHYWADAIGAGAGVEAIVAAGELKSFPAEEEVEVTSRKRSTQSGRRKVVG